MTKKIEFASETEFLEKPKPAKKYIPEWYRKAERFVGGKPFLNGGSRLGEGARTVKLCVPFLDSMTNGYMIELFQDVQVVIDDNGIQSLQWSLGDFPVAEARNMNTVQGMPVPIGCSEQLWTWKLPYSWRLPKGYSALVVHPLNHFELPFVTTNGIVDADGIVNEGNIPFFLKEGFEGFIPYGTPIAQIIPYKRDNWKSVMNPELVKEARRKKWSNLKVLNGWYKYNSWVRKDFN